MATKEDEGDEERKKKKTQARQLVTATLVLSSLFLVKNFSIVSCTAAAFCTNHRSGKYEIRPKMNRRSYERKRFPSNDKNIALASQQQYRQQPSLAFFRVDKHVFHRFSLTL